MVTVNNKGLKMIAFLLLAFTFAKQQKRFFNHEFNHGGITVKEKQLSKTAMFRQLIFSTRES